MQWSKRQCQRRQNESWADEETDAHSGASVDANACMRSCVDGNVSKGNCTEERCRRQCGARRSQPPSLACTRPKQGEHCGALSIRMEVNRSLWIDTHS